MILRTNRLQEGVDVKEENGNLVLTRAVNVEPVLEANYHARKDLQNGWSKDRSYRRIGSIDFDVWNELIKRHPEIVCGDSLERDRLILKWLNSDEGRQWKTVDKI